MNSKARKARVEKEMGMKSQLKDMARPYAALFAIALVVALIARIALAVAAATGALAFDYISVSGVPVLDVLCSIMTGSALVAFMFAASLALGVSLAGVALQGLLYARGRQGAGRPAAAFLWGWATALVALVCLVIVVLGILSAVQVGSMSSKLPGIPVLIAVVVVFAAFLGTLLAAASCVVRACIARARAKRSECALYRNLVVATAVCGAVVAVLTVGTVAAINMTPLDPAAAGVWFAVDIAANLATMFTADRMAAKAELASGAAE